MLLLFYFIYFFFLEKLSSDHTEKVIKHEREQEKLLRERQQAFGEVFKEDLQEYKKTGSVPSEY